MARNRSVTSPSVYFAVAPTSPRLADQVLEEWQRRLAQEPRLHLYALVDCLIAPDFVDFCVREGWQAPTSIYADQIGLDSGRMWSPSLLALSAEMASLHQQVTSIGQHCSSKPALGFIASRYPIEVVKAQLLRLACVADGDGSRWLVRFGDTRVWPPAEKWLTPEQHAHAFAGLDTWMIVNRYGQLQTFDGSPDTDPACPNVLVTDFRISPSQFSRMCMWGEADAHLARLAGTWASVQSLRRPIEQYDIASQCLATLDQLGVTDEQHRYQCIRRALLQREPCDNAVQSEPLVGCRHEPGVSAAATQPIIRENHSQVDTLSKGICP
ncbi:DUF4123 domain-containing protein [Cupriavidus sp. WGlv3]|uniref:DUF4123 domain-containing protein n=1 Tax=Cupriavidus sp. WGlv3 TaxID=2919924 RepID=UPI002091913F|nr:DUF4123 domain-containing protein [Cupriavidus sp. WGlv3]MCO4861793.1 DUF4123 domain-containing protein [Cupriavidus sp. WGlv3]